MNIFSERGNPLKILVLSGDNHGFAASAQVIHDFLAGQPDMQVTLADDKGLLAAPALRDFDAIVFGTGFTRSSRQADGTVKREPDLSPQQEEGLMNFVASGKGIAAIHGSAWWIGGRAMELLGGAANWHPPGLTFTVHIDNPGHAITQGVSDFEVEDEIYISAYEPQIQVLASAEWHGRAHPMAWVKQYGQGRVFYTTLGHTAGTFQRPAMQQLFTQGVRWAATV
jgi:type 1 glutamine amidotransferase